MRSERDRPSIEIVGDIAGEEVIAIGGRIREIERLRKVYGRGRWRKMKVSRSFAPRWNIFSAEVHWYERHGIAGRIQDQAPAGRTAMRKPSTANSYVLCVRNDGYPRRSSCAGCTSEFPIGCYGPRLFRVVDESGKTISTGEVLPASRSESRDRAIRAAA